MLHGLSQPGAPKVTSLDSRVPSDICYPFPQEQKDEEKRGGAPLPVPLPLQGNCSVVGEGLRGSREFSFCICASTCGDFHQVPGHAGTWAGSAGTQPGFICEFKNMNDPCLQEPHPGPHRFLLSKHLHHPFLTRIGCAPMRRLGQLGVSPLD